MNCWVTWQVKKVFSEGLSMLSALSSMFKSFIFQIMATKSLKIMENITVKQPLNSTHMIREITTKRPGKCTSYKT